MSLQVRAIAIYSDTGELRKVEFKLNSLNIVTGAPKTGKSALLDIVDYCWGKELCGVAEGEIRRSVSWFAVLFDRSGEGILVARKNPGPARRTSDEIYFERNVAALPDSPAGFSKNATASGLRSRLSALLGVAENINVPEAGSARPPLQASASQAIFFCLQCQDEIANRRLLFHRQGEEGIPTAIKDSLPYFLGAMAEDHFLNQLRHVEARRRLRAVERALGDAQALSREAAATARNLLQDARRAGLLVDGSGDPGTLDGALKLLAAAAAPRERGYLPLDDPSADLSDLEDRRRQLRGSLQDTREEIKDVHRQLRDASEFEQEAREQHARLSSIGLLADDGGGHGTCPLCDSRLEVPVPAVADMRSSLSGLDRQLGAVRRDNPRLQGRIAALEEARALQEEGLAAVQRDISARIAQNERLRVEQDQFTEQARVAGRIGYYLENVSAVADDDGLRLRFARCRAEVEELERALDSEAMEERLTTALGIVGRDLTEFAIRLELEHGNNSLRLDRKNLTVVADTIDGPLALPQIGSGENWVGYHVAAHLALHKLLRARRRPVPAFLMLDQPSQAHYPPDRDAGEIAGGENEDQAAVYRLFRLLWDYCDTAVPDMQVIVTDHVELLADWFRAATVQRWRDGIKLVPMAWLR